MKRRKYIRSQSSREDLQKLCRRLFLKNIEYRRRQKIVDDFAELVMLRAKEIPEEAERLHKAIWPKGRPHAKSKG